QWVDVAPAAAQRQAAAARTGVADPVASLRCIGHCPGSAGGAPASQSTGGLPAVLPSARLALLALVSLLVLAPPASARICGIVGFSDIGCIDCHDSEGATPPAVAIVGPTTVEPGTQIPYQVVVTSMGPLQV